MLIATAISPMPDMPIKPRPVLGHHRFYGPPPLPDFTLLAKKLGAWGIANDSQVIVYDDAGGAFAGRLCGCYVAWDRIKLLY